jgi:hypothetical protein
MVSMAGLLAEPAQDGKWEETTVAAESPARLP